MMYVVPAITLLFGVTHRSASGFVAVPRRHWAAKLTFRPAVTRFSSTADSDSNVVWVRVIIDDSDNDIEAFKITPKPLDVADLKDAVHQRVQPELGHCSAATLKVFAPGTDLADPEHSSKALDPKLKLSKFEEHISNEQSFIVKAKSRVLPDEHIQLRALKSFDLAHLASIKVDESWIDIGENLEFTGRTDFVAAVKEHLECESTPDFTMTKTNSKALVYSSVSGSGKTVSMLELKSKLKEVNHVPVIVAYLGFNTGLSLSEFESSYISNSNDRDIGAERVLARRLAAATIISIENPDVVSKLPRYDMVYDGYEMPTVERSKQLIIDHTGSSNEKPIYIVAGLDEVQLLNRRMTVGVTELGRLFLRILRNWRHDWYNQGIRILPLGTGVAVDWASDPTTGLNIPLSGSDTTLISKQDFHLLVQKVVDGLSVEDITNRFSIGTSKYTIVDLIAASYWPRVRLLKWWRDNDKNALRSRTADSNQEQWVNWLCYWLLDKTMSINDFKLIPGKNDNEGKILCLFEISKDAQRFSIIPDGYSASSIIARLNDQLPVPHLYDRLDIQSLDPTEFIMQDENQFEKLGFHVVGAAIHVGLHALHKARTISWDSATSTQRKRLGLALWFQDKKAVIRQETGEMYVPKILGRVDSTGNYGDFYPFATRNQTRFVDEVVLCLQQSAYDFTPVYIFCGRLTCCDYLYFYAHKGQKSQTEFMCAVVDAKHTNQVGSKGDRIPSADQEKLCSALDKVKIAVAKAKQVLGGARLLFLTNKKALATSKHDADHTKTIAAASVKPELLNKDRFEFGPFTDILWARRKSHRKKDLPVSYRRIK